MEKFLIAAIFISILSLNVNAQEKNNQFAEYRKSAIGGQKKAPGVNKRTKKMLGIIADTEERNLLGWRVKLGASSTAHHINVDKGGAKGKLINNLEFDNILTSYLIGLSSDFNYFKGDTNWGYLFEFDYVNFSIESGQVISGNNAAELGSKVEGYMIYATPVLAYNITFSPEHYLFGGVGYGLSYIKAKGNIYLTNDNVGSSCKQSLTEEDIKNNCEKLEMDLYGLTDTYAFVFTYQYKYVGASYFLSRPWWTKDDINFYLDKVSLKLYYVLSF